MLYFSQEELQKVQKQRRKHIIIYVSSAVAFLIFTIGMFLWYTTLPYKSPTITVVKIIEYVVVALFVIYSFIYLGLVFRRVNRYYKTLVDLKNNKKENYSGSFIGYDETLHEYNGVDFKTLNFLEWNKYRKEYFERDVYVFYERDFPKLKENQIYNYKTQSNILYEIEISENKQSEDQK
ncbi:MAG: hypothetical protein IKW33_02945 [Clostridia bacterium]|nr:hypothetical protein [Clostridia bacterium]